MKRSLWEVSDNFVTPSSKRHFGDPVYIGTPWQRFSCVIIPSLLLFTLAYLVHLFLTSPGLQIFGVPLVLADDALYANVLVAACDPGIGLSQALPARVSIVLCHPATAARLAVRRGGRARVLYPPAARQSAGIVPGRPRVQTNVLFNDVATVLAV